MYNRQNHKIAQSLYQSYRLLHCLTLPFVFMFSEIHASEEDVDSYNYLKSLNIEELIKVEVTLDEAFNVFDGLVKAKKVSIATGNQQLVAHAPAVTTVITAQDIEAIGARDLDEVLETIPGLHVARDTQGYRPIYSMRGIHTARNPEVLMLVNGIPITALYTGDRGFVWGSMPINIISRIEVIRGPGSAIYGADAFAGVINILTKTKEDIKGNQVGGRIGSFKTREGWALHSGAWYGFDIAAGLEYRTTDGQKGLIQEDAQTQFDKFFGTHASLAPGSVDVGEEGIDSRIDIKKGYWQARAGYQKRRDLGLGAGLAQALTPEGYSTVDRTNADITYHNPEIASHWDVTAQFSYLDIAWQVFENRVFPRGAFGGTYPDGYIGNPGVSESHSRLDTFAFYSGLQQHLLRLGAGYHNADQYKITAAQNFGINPETGLPLPPGAPVIDITDTPYIFNQEKQRKNWYLSLQDMWTITDEWEFTAGIRYDKYSDFGGTTNPRAALVWQPCDNFIGKLMYGKAFRAPSFNEFYDKNNPSALGNPNLKPETLDTWELAFDYQMTQNAHFTANLFRYDIEDKIALMSNKSGEIWIFQNIGRWKGEGLELETRWKMSKKSSLLANYSYVKVTDKQNASDIGNYPRHSAYVRTDWLLMSNWYLDIQANWIADRQRVFGDPRPEIADYTTVDLTLRYKNVREGHTNIALGVRNLFNADAREPSLGPDSKGIVSIPYDLPLTKRNLFVELRYQF